MPQEKQDVEEETSTITARVPTDIHTQLRIRAIEERVNLQDLVGDILMNAIGGGSRPARQPATRTSGQRRQGRRGQANGNAEPSKN